MEKLLIIDGNSLANRAFYAMPFMTNHKGEPTGAIYGFTNILINLISGKNLTNIVVAFDHARKTFRNKIFADYKGTRKPTPPELIEQMVKIKELLNTMGIKTIELEDIEADDIIGTIAKKHLAENILLSGDRDLWQLIDSKTSVWFTKRGVTDLEILDENSLRENYNILPYQIVELKSLMGDSSDNIPGVKGIGEKTAKTLIEAYQTIDGVYNNIEEIKGANKQKLIDGKDSAYMSHQLATIKTDCHIDLSLKETKINFPFKKEVYDKFEEYDFASFTKKKELFDFNIEEPKVSKEKVQIKNTQELKSKLETISPKELVIDFTDGLYLEFSYCIFKFQEQLTLFNATETENVAEVLDVVKKYIQDKNITKITNSYKELLYKLKDYNITDIPNCFDVSIAEYLTSFSEVVKKPCAQTYLLEKYYDLKQKLKDYDMVNLYNNIDFPLAKVLFDMEVSGFKIDAKELDELLSYYTKIQDKLKSEIIELAGEDFNINSPKQLSTILFDKLGLVSYNKKNKSTGVEVLTYMLNQHPIIEKIINYRRYQKLVSTYLEPYHNLLDGNQNIIHTVFNQTGTNTGRLSSSEPNLQNIPIRNEEGKILRKLFISRFKGGNLVSADYSQVELRLVANMSKDENMCQDFLSGKDIHTATASQIFEVPISDVTPEMRRTAKAVNFGIIYGISDYGLAENIQTSPKEAGIYIAKYFNKYHGVKTYLDNLVIEANKKGYAETYFKRRRVINELKASNYNIRQFGERVAKNMPLQGTASDVIKIAMINLHNWLKNNNMQSKLILQIHDELIVDTTPEETEIVKNKMKEIMESVVNFEVPLIADVNAGKNLLECK